jgi:hypothetical protein
VRVDRLFEPVDLTRHDPQGHGAGREIVVRAARGRGQIGAKIEQVVLDARQFGGNGRRRNRRYRQHGKAQCAVGLVHLADGDHARIVLGPARAIDQPGRASVPVRV